MTSTRPRRALAAVLAAVAVVVLAGCAAIPTGGPVRDGQSLKDESVSGVDFRPNSPTPGADQDTILRQFIDAATGAQDNYAIAREFLSDSFAQKWNPRQSVTIRQGSGAVDRTGTRELTYTLTASATVDADGEYTQAVRPTSSTLTFQFVKEDGEWRIAYAPDGVILTPVSFEQVFQAHALYFYDPTYRYLVPDERWFLARSSTSTRIASALLSGPADWLKGAVVSSFPEGTQLSLNAVTVDNGSAQVDLSSDALRATTVDKVRMREQLARSLSSVATISSVELTIEGASFSVPDSSGTSAVVNPDVDPRPLVEDGGAVGFAAPGTGDVAKLGSGLGDAIAKLDPTSIALSASGADAAVGDADGVFVVRSGKKPLRIDARDHLIAPSIDDQGFVWTAQSTNTRAITAYGLGGDPHQVSSTLPDGDLVSFQVSRDSTRALALIDTDDGPALYVMAITRDSDRTPTALGSPVRLQAASGTAVGATWVSDLDVASLGQTSSGPSIVRSTIGGQSTVLQRPDGRATQIAGGSGGTLLLRTADGQVLQSTGGGWDRTGVTASVLGTQR
ncbi:sporulation and spore germination protein [Curtobacterium sp. PhB130]|uniref:LpqB family beta-propeller domain-containing protein n=1 Tax=unclassified Curtobacterium TaxID=257496 RepID=UPI000F4B0A6A|nr:MULTISPECIES: LpqB family beta-propeller domain-containing protein [unclassified Curtobacterium]ROS76409.1 sporulation and spore germination protein [Curtobacterium sp. PhB130]TCK59740.1 sporulation and spore germination protein [Curtobacterium sp. PhB136]